MLANVSCNYNPDLSSREQAALDLKAFIEECNKRTDRALAAIRAREKRSDANAA